MTGAHVRLKELAYSLPEGTRREVSVSVEAVVSGAPGALEAFEALAWSIRLRFQAALLERGDLPEGSLLPVLVGETTSFLVSSAGAERYESMLASLLSRPDADVVTAFTRHPFTLEGVPSGVLVPYLVLGWTLPSRLPGGTRLSEVLAAAERLPDPGREVFVVLLSEWPLGLPELLHVVEALS